jgi:transcriptional regulator with XRE-family HTH domain
MQTIGERIKQLRTGKHVTQEDLAKIAGLKDRSSIANWEADRVTPDYVQLQRVAKFFNVTIDYIINGKKEVNVTVFTQDDVDFVRRFHALPTVGQHMMINTLENLEEMFSKPSATKQDRA